MVTLTLDDVEVKKKLSQVAKGFSDYREPLNNAGKDLLGFYGDEVFKSQGSDAGKAWKSLSTATLYARQKRQGHYSQSPIASGQILVWTGALKQGFKKEVTKDTLRIYNTVPYFKYHQQGGKAPQRAMLVINQAVTTRVMKHFYDYANSQLKK